MVNEAAFKKLRRVLRGFIDESWAHLFDSGLYFVSEEEIQAALVELYPDGNIEQSIRVALDHKAELMKEFLRVVDGPDQEKADIAWKECFGISDVSTEGV
jgi:hypothetical protein